MNLFKRWPWISVTVSDEPPLALLLWWLVSLQLRPHHHQLHPHVASRVLRSGYFKWNVRCDSCDTAQTSWSAGWLRFGQRVICWCEGVISVHVWTLVLVWRGGQWRRGHMIMISSSWKEQLFQVLEENEERASITRMSLLWIWFNWPVEGLVFMVHILWFDCAYKALALLYYSTYFMMLICLIGHAVRVLCCEKGWGDLCCILEGSGIS